ncbi:MAG: exodeoxyribonuclease III [Nanoarchaeota archaeon]|nr:exodeoxyribonuclease III [Nanoarchaeota archaeon]
MKIISWNVNGIRSVMRKGFNEFLEREQPDMLCLQETKINEKKEFEGYHSYWHFAEKKGYSGTAILTKQKPLSVTKMDSEGRILTLEFEKFFLVNVYVINAQRELARLEYKRKWNEQFRQYLQELNEKKPVILCGDLNVAHKEIDLTNPKTNTKNPGFSSEEREDFTKLLNTGFTDTFRMFNKESGQYTWWTYRFKARERNVGWRIDYFLTSKRLENKIENSKILKYVMGSDHAPIKIILKQ